MSTTLAPVDPYSQAQGFATPDLSMAPLLAVEALGVRMGIQQILSDVSLRVPERGVITVLGANGVGKTTLMRTISGVYRASTGRIAFAGEPIERLRPHRIVARGLAQAPEGRQIFSNMSVRENLILGAGRAKSAERRQVLEEVLGRFPVLAERMVQQAGSLSGGEQQMLCIGRALMSRPRLLLLDEPFIGVAPLLVDEILAALRRIAEQGVTMLLVEQNTHRALDFVDRAYVLENGRTVLEGSREALLGDPAFAAKFLGLE